MSVRALQDVKAGVRAGGRERIAFLVRHDIGPPGHELALSWSGAAGATDVDVTAALLTLAPADVVHSQQDLPITVAGSNVDITIPAHERVRSVALEKLRSGDETDLRDEAALNAKGMRLTVSLHDGKAFSPPQHAVPAVSGGQMMPAILAGASFSGGVLGLNDVNAGKLRLNLAQGDTPTEFVRQPISCKRALGVTVLPSRDVSVLGPDGATVFAVPDELPDVRGGHEVDLRHALKQALAAALKAGAPLQAAFRVRGAAGCAVMLRLGAVHGALLRTQAGVLSTEVSGAPAPLLLTGALAPAAPNAATGDLSVKYLGLRVLAEFSDAVPAFGGTRGSVVRETPVLRSLPPAALAGLPLARVGIIGRAPEPCELSLQLVEDAGGGLAGKALGPPATRKLQPGAAAQGSAAAGLVADRAGAERVECHWIELPELPAPKGPVALSLRVTSGRFFWAGAEQPLVRLAVRDPDPGGRPLKLGGSTLLSVHESIVHLPAFAFPAARFAGGPANASGIGGASGAGGALPLLDSDLFLTVDVSDLVLRYAR